MNQAERNLRWATALIDGLVRRGVDYFALASGSRSTPLTVAVARHADAGPGCTVHYDERALAFQALGFARATGRPAAVITTSGSAVAHLFPGVVEAAQARVPMILLTADRPAELRGTGANQTIDQVEFFGRYARWFADLVPSDDREMAEQLADEALARAAGYPAGPVHLNLMFPEPLVPEPGLESGRAMVAGIDPGKCRPPASRERQDVPASTDPMVEALDTLMDGERTLIVAGSLPSSDAARAVQGLADSLGWPVLPDITSGLRLGPGGPNRIARFDALLQEETPAEPADTVLHVGGPFISRRLSRYLAASRPEVVVQASGSYGRVDPDGIVTLGVPGTVEAFCAAAMEHLSEDEMGKGVGDDWRDGWAERDSAADRAVSSFFARGSELSEPWVARRISELLPVGHGLILGNSMPVRDMDTFAAVTGEPARVVANRGASGIDGTLATANGFVRGAGAPATVLLGDLALLHDLTSLHLVARSEIPLVVVVVNNDGGGIFHFLPIARHEDVFDAFFGTPHGMHFESAARQFGVGYACPNSREEFDAAYGEAVARGDSALIEVATDRRKNARVHEELLRHVQDTASGLVGRATGRSRRLAKKDPARPRPVLEDRPRPTRRVSPTRE